MTVVLFIINSIALGVGLAMDAFSVSLINGLREPDMGKNRMCRIALVYAGFQYAMPMIGWICVHTILRLFRAFEKFIPWIAMLLLLYIGGKMVLEGLRGGSAAGEETEGPRGGNAAGGQVKPEGPSLPRLTAGTLLLQGIATSIDALSVGFTIADYHPAAANAAALIIAAVTFLICLGGLLIGRKAGTALSGRASILGGIILILIGFEILITHLLH